MNSKYVVNIGRQLGSGGRGDRRETCCPFGHWFYDKELIKMAADDIDIEEHIFEMYDQAFMDKHETVHDILTYTYEVPMSDQIFMAQSRVIHRLAQHGPCVIVGALRGYGAKDEQCLNLYFYASLKKRVQRLLELDGLSEENAKQVEQKVREVDQKRKDYYQYYTGNEWGKPKNYHLCLDSLKAGMDACVAAVTAYMAHLR